MFEDRQMSNEAVLWTFVVLCRFSNIYEPLFENTPAFIGAVELDPLLLGYHLSNPFSLNLSILFFMQGYNLFFSI